MKQKLFTLLAFLTSVGTMFASVVKIGDLYYADSIIVKFTPPKTFTYDTLLYLTYSPDDDKYAGDIVIPASVEYNGRTFEITSIGDNVFSGCTGLTSIKIPNSVTLIGHDAFSGCCALTSVTIPNSVTSIGYYAFSNVPNIMYTGSATGSPWGAICVNGYVEGFLVYSDASKTNLVVCLCSAEGSISIPNTTKSIENSAFSGCSSLTSITIPNSVTSIGNYAFCGCSGLTSITIPNSVTSIGNNAFRNCTGLTSITIPNSVTNIGNNAFSGCTNLPVIDNIRYADTYLIEAIDKSLSTYSIKSDTRWIGISAFDGCTGLTSITIPNSVTSIGNYAFYGCSGLTSIEIPNSVTSIGNNAFSGCTNLPVIDNIRYADTYLIEAVDKSLSTYSIRYGTRWIGGSAFSGCSSLTSITIPNSVTNIGNEAFSGCTGLTSITIPNSVTSIGNWAFNSVPNIMYTGSATGSPWGAICVNGFIDGWLVYSDASKTNLVRCSRSAEGSISISNTTKSIENSAFSGCTGLTSVIIPNSVTSIGGYAFYNCSGLTSVTIPNSVTSIGESAFLGCTNLPVIDNIRYADTYLIEAVDKSLSTYSIKSDTRWIGGYAFSSCAGLTSIEIPNSVTSIGDNAFSSCTSLTSITIPNSVTSIGEWAFNHCYNLKSANIPNSVTSIETGAFRHCYNFKHVFIPRSVTSIGAWAFHSLGYQTSIVIEEGNPVYDSRNNCNAIIETATNTLLFGCQNTVIPEGVERIGEYAFFGNLDLTSIVIPSSVTSIEQEAFSSCANLAAVYNQASTPQSFGQNAFYGWNDERWDGRKQGPVDMSKCILYVPEASVELYKAAEGWKKFKNIRFVGIVASGTCGKNGDNLTWVLYSDDTFTISGTGEMANFTKGNAPWYSYKSSIAKVSMDNGVTSIGNYAFYGCTGLTSIEVPSNITSIGSAAFDGCTNLTSIIWNAEHCNDFYNNSPFYSSKGKINSFIIGDDVEYIPAYLCYEMKNVPQIIVSNCKAEAGTNAFSGCKSVLWNKLQDFTMTIHDEYDTSNSGSISFSIDNYAGNYYYSLNGKENASLSNLSAGQYRLVFYGEVCGDSIVKNAQIKQYGMRVNNQYYLLDRSNHTATMTYRGTSYDAYSGEYSSNITIPEVISFEGQEYVVTGIGTNAFTGCNNIQSTIMTSKTPISISNSCGLPSSTLIYVPYGSLNAYKTAQNWSKYNIHVINPSHSSSLSGATSVTITLGDNDEAKHIVSCGMEGGEEFAGNIIEYIGLEPESQYADVPFFVKTKEGDHDILSCSFSTSALQLTTQESKPVSSNTAILLAETNMAEIETSCGFEWKRNDAPEDMTPNKVFCPVANGLMAGRLKGLKEEVYYKYRAFYQSAAGNMYYGDWKYIFTGDVAVEFDPILYTYAAIAVKENEATLKGYALAGSEDFTEQGFEYWAESRANNAPRRTAASIGEHKTVTASGISMKATLTDLDEGTVYRYRSYAKIGSQTLYGSEMTLTTLGEYHDSQAIEDIHVDASQATKILHNGQIYILRGDKVYILTGQEVR